MTGNEMVGDISSPTSSSRVKMCNIPYFTVFVASFGYFIIGTVITWSSHAMYFLMRDDPGMIMFEMVVTISTAAAVIPLVVYKMLNGISLKYLVVLAAVFTLISQAISSLLEVMIQPLLFSGFILDGLALGAVHFLIPTYLEDLMGGGSCKETRLRIDNILCIQLATGIFTIYGIVNSHYANLINMFTTVFPALIFVVGLFFIPQSPRYLCTANRSEEARQILQRFRGSLRNSGDTRQIDADIDFWSRKQDKINFGSIFESVNSIKLFLPTLGLIFWEQMIGIVVIFFSLLPCLIYYYELTSGIVESFIVAAGFIVGTLLAIFLRLKINHKYLLTISGIIMGVILIILGIYDHYQESTNRLNKNFGYFPTACFSAFHMLYAFGFRRSVSIYQNVLIERKKLVLFRSLRTSITWATVTLFALIFAYGWHIVGLGWILIFIGCFNLLAVICILACISSSVAEIRSRNQEHWNNFENVPLDNIL